jgi:hypothetical protein
MHIELLTKKEDIKKQIILFSQKIFYIHLPPPQQHLATFSSNCSINRVTVPYI